MSATKSIPSKEGTAKHGAPVTPKLIGFLDSVRDDGVLHGWAWNESKPNRATRIAVGIDGDTVHQLSPQDFRADLVAAGIGHGCYAFKWRIPDTYRDGKSHEFRIIHLEHRRELPGSPLQATIPAREENRKSSPIGLLVNHELTVWPHGLVGEFSSRSQEIAPGLFVTSTEASGNWRYMVREPRRNWGGTTANFGVWIDFDNAASYTIHHRISPAAASILKVGATVSLEANLGDATEALAQKPIEIHLSRQTKDGIEFIRRISRGRVFRRPTLLSLWLQLNAEEQTLATSRNLFVSTKCDTSKSLYYYSPQIVEAKKLPPGGLVGFEDTRLVAAIEACHKLAVQNRKKLKFDGLFLQLQDEETAPAPDSNETMKLASLADSAYPFTQIIVPVFNGDFVVTDCLRSIKNCTSTPYQVLILNDGSRVHTTNLLKEFAATDPRFLLYNREENKGYTKSINEAVKLTGSDWIVILNSDTVVSQNWLKKLHDAAISRENIGMVGPLSNAASWQSLPRTKETDGSWSKNDFIEPEMLPVISQIVEKYSRRAYPSVPILNGFCTLISREVFQKIGLFDEDAFPIGYGEETDLCIRATKEGFHLVVADDCFVYHRKSVSFGKKGRKPLSKAGSIELTNKHFDVSIPNLERVMQANPDLARLRTALEDMKEQVQKWRA